MATFGELQTELAKALLDSTSSSPRWPVVDKKRFINAAIRNANDAGARRMEKNEDLVVIANAVIYELPFLTMAQPQVFGVAVEGETNQPFNPKYAWDIIGYAHPGVGTAWALALPKAFTETVGNTIRVQFLMPHAELILDGDETLLPTEYVIAYALFKAYKETRTAAEVDRQYYLAEAKNWYDVAEAKLQRLLDQQPQVGGRVIGQIV